MEFLKEIHLFDERRVSRALIKEDVDFDSVVSVTISKSKIVGGGPIRVSISNENVEKEYLKHIKETGNQLFSNDPDLTKIKMAVKLINSDNEHNILKKNLLVLDRVYISRGDTEIIPGPAIITEFAGLFGFLSHPYQQLPISLMQAIVTKNKEDVKNILDRVKVGNSMYMSKDYSPNFCIVVDEPMSNEEALSKWNF